MYSCKHCSKQFTTSQGLNSHQKTHSSIKHTTGYKLGAGKYQQDQKQIRINQYTNDPKLCLFCNAPLPRTIDINVRKFCNNSCSAKFNNTKRVPKIKKTKVKTIHFNLCNQCNQPFIPKLKTVKFCSKMCRSTHAKLNPRPISEESRRKMRNGGLRSATVQGSVRRSKNERLFHEMCVNNYGNVDCNQPIFNGWDADVILYDHRVAVLWNGRWHYHQITQKHSVSQVQNRDRIKIKEITKSGYTPYVIQDLGRPGKTANYKFVIKQFELFQYWLNQLNVNTNIY